MTVAATTVKKPSENSPIKRARRRRCERKQTPQNRVIATKGKSWEKTVEAASLLREQEARGSNPRAPTSHLIALSGLPFAVGQHHSLRCILRPEDSPRFSCSKLHGSCARSPDWLDLDGFLRELYLTNNHEGSHAVKRRPRCYRSTSQTWHQRGVRSSELSQPLVLDAS